MDRANRRKALSVDQMISVAEERWKDAACLFDAKRWNGAIYLAGITVECILKGLLLDRHPNLKTLSDVQRLSASDRFVPGLIFKSHELDTMLAIFRTEIEAKMGSADREAYMRFQRVCSEWTIRVRYSPKHSNRDKCEQFLNAVSEVRTWLKRL